MLSRVEKYDIIDEIGHGGMATVYRARDTRLDRLVALKVMHPHLQSASEARARFSREALAVARLKHPSILEIYDYSGEDSDISFITTELLTGPTLKKFSDDHPDIPAEIAACFVIQVARALVAAHAEGIIHRDVKPENVLLHEGLVKLADFGIAQLVDAQSMTTTGQVLGSPGHMAPEQIEGKDCDARTDLFALGTVLYLLATGVLPFVGKNAHQVLRLIVDGRFTDPANVRPSIGGKLRAIVLKLLAMEPSARYQTARAVELDLLAFVREVGIEHPEETLKEYLSDTDGFVTRFRPQLIERLTTLGEAAMRRGERMVAMDYFNRVLALDDGNARVMQAVGRIGRKRAMRRAVVLAATAGLVLGAGAFALELLIPPRARQLSFSASPTAVKVAAPGPGSTKAVGPSGPRGTLGASTQPKASHAASDTARHNAPHPRAVAVSTEPREVVFAPTPANVSISVDGQAARAYGPSFHKVELPPGDHTFRFIGAHDCCVDDDVTVKIPAGPGSTTVTHKLTFRPSGLYVESNVPANVAVDGGSIAGRTRSLIRVPHDADLVEVHRIRVSADGYMDITLEVRTRAGQVSTVQAQLEPSSASPKITG